MQDYEEEANEEESGAVETEIREDDEAESEDDIDEQITKEDVENSRKQKRTRAYLLFLLQE